MMNWSSPPLQRPRDHRANSCAGARRRCGGSSACAGWTAGASMRCPRPWLRRRRRRRRGPVRGRGRTLGRCGRRRRRCACRAAGSRRVPAVPPLLARCCSSTPGSHGRGRVASLLLLLLLPLNRLNRSGRIRLCCDRRHFTLRKRAGADGAATNAQLSPTAAIGADALRGDFRGVAVFRCLLLGARPAQRPNNASSHCGAGGRHSLRCCCLRRRCGSSRSRSWCRRSSASLPRSSEWRRVDAAVSRGRGFRRSRRRRRLRSARRARRCPSIPLAIGFT